jgi:hypothetical protein
VVRDDRQAEAASSVKSVVHGDISFAVTKYPFRNYTIVHIIIPGVSLNRRLYRSRSNNLCSVLV